MVKSFFCDVFGPFSREDPYDKPLDPKDVQRCLKKVRQNQAAKEMAREPLVATIEYPSAPQMNYRPPSPPPAYSDIDKVVPPL
uniref:Uncharacterized protein n=1 Tax=Caenorhabditis japonica TaxID=281687 RepID=A0A8R1DVB8_CAEJA